MWQVFLQVNASTPLQGDLCNMIDRTDGTSIGPLQKRPDRRRPTTNTTVGGGIDGDYDSIRKLLLQQVPENSFLIRFLFHGTYH
jgi:hypothetical protein